MDLSFLLQFSNDFQAFISATVALFFCWQLKVHVHFGNFFLFVHKNHIFKVLTFLVCFTASFRNKEGSEMLHMILITPCVSSAN